MPPSSSGNTAADARLSFCLLNGVTGPAIYEDAVECRELSRGGVVFTTRRMLAPAAAVQLCFALPQRPYQVLSLGRVVTCEPLETEPVQLVNVEFLGFPSRSLTKYLNRFDLPEDVELELSEDDTSGQTAVDEAPQSETEIPG